MSATRTVYPTLPVRVRRSGSRGGGGGGPRYRGYALPSVPPGGNLWDFVKFVHDLLENWTQRVAKQEFRQLDATDRDAIARGWRDFDAQWSIESPRLQQVLQNLPYDDLHPRGLVDEALDMKLHFVRKRWTELATKAAGALSIRKAWHKLFTAIDIILDSIGGAASFTPGVGAIVSGLKEFKETAMGVSE